ncbi:MAG: prolyl-tRNA synthetase associated domain-containing protein [Lachnospiraceae bacterium]|nr:prolyl-tRNA synthetase associated domain-containing protein [Lachnospiraceae bacterium]
MIKATTPVNTKPSPEGRLAKEMAVYDLLEELEIPYERMDHEVTASIEDCHEVDKILGIHICKNLFLCNSQKTAFYLLMMPGEKKFLTKDLSKQINSARLSFAGPEYMEKYLNITPGSVSIMGLMNDKEHQVKLLIDSEVLKEEYLGCHPCINTSSLKLKLSDVLEKFLSYTGHDYTVVTL